jgi:hypothetical protein
MTQKPALNIVHAVCAQRLLTYDLFFSGTEDAGGEGGVGEQAVQIRRQVA